MNNFLLILKKELFRVLKDKKMIFALIFPGLMIFLMYSFIGSTFSSLENTNTSSETYSIIVRNLPNEIKQIALSLEYDFEYTELQDNADPLNYEDAIKNKEILLIVDFPANFVESVSNGLKPNIGVYYNPSYAQSNEAYTKFNECLSVYQTGVLINTNSPIFFVIPQTFYNENDILLQVVSMILPMMLVMFLFSGSMAVTPEAIAGEKERGTMASLLLTPTPTQNIVLAKVSALSILTSISALSSFLGIIFSLPKLLNLGNASILSLFSIVDLLLLFLILVVTVFLITSLLTIISTLSKSVKEANMYAAPLMIVASLLSLIPMLLSTSSGLYIYIIPMLNTVITIRDIINSSINPLYMLVTIGTNLIATSGLIFLVVKLFNNEKVMFSS